MGNLATRRTEAHRDTAGSGGRDRGAVLPLILVLVVIGSLVVLPVMSYATTVLKANSVLSAKTQRFEAVKGGLRTALYDPLDLYRRCDEQGVPKAYSTMNMNGVEVRTTCQIVGNAKTVIDDHLRYGLASTELGQTVPAILKGKKYANPTTPSDWVGLTTSALEDTPTESRPGTIWLPDLPSYPRTVRTRVQGYDMPASYLGCKVYFPGTYRDNIVLTGPTFFASGIYYFEGEVRVQAGARVTVGDGFHQGCASSQEAVFFATPALPQTEPHNITGFGATWLFGGAGRLVVSNQAGPVNIVFNRRYVDDRATDPSLFVSIASVNGEIAPDGTYRDLLVPNPLNAPILNVPQSRVMVARDVHESPIAHGMKPSTLTPTPQPPAAPVSVTATAFRRTSPAPIVQGVYIKWSDPALEAQGGLPIERYEVVRQGETTPLCTVYVATGAPRDCWVTGLTSSGPGITHTFEVRAIHAKGASLPATVSAVIKTDSPATSYTAPTVAKPAVPPAADRFIGAVRVTVPAVTAGSLPPTRYTISAERHVSGSTWATTGTPCTIDPRAYQAPTSCIVRDLGLVAVNLRFKVTVENALASSAVASVVSDTLALPITGLLAAPANPTPAPPPGLPVVPPVVATPIVDINLSGASPSSIRIPGYLAVPQGTVTINNTPGHPMQVVGGMLAARYNVVDGRVTGGCTNDCVDLGFESEVVQHRLRVVSTTPSGKEQSVALVQINENGAYAVNSWEVQ